jgi:tetratricopeptide (TPR) repeat protein
VDAWKLIKANRFRDAVSLLTAELSDEPSVPLYNNRGMAYLHLGEFQKALSDFRAADDITRREDGGERPGAMSGVALWLAGEHQRAVSIWTRGTEAMLAGSIRYTDAAGGVSIANLLWFASIRLHEPAGQTLATKLLRKKLRTKQSQSWPGPISRFLLGGIDEPQLRAAAARTRILRERELCQAEFYVGVAAFEADRQRYYELMRASAKYGSLAKLEAEYYLATYEASHEIQSTAA